MIALLNTPFSELLNSIPSAKTVVIGLLLSGLWTGGLLAGAGYLKSRKGWKTGYTRKLFHFGVFGTVFVVNGFYGIPEVCLVGAMTTAVIILAVVCGEGHPLYEALAREKDAPHRTRYIIEPYVATLMGGVLVNLFFPETAQLGYLVAGLGDAVAEPVGTRFGRHRYRVPTLDGTLAERSLEGSASVWIVSSLSLCLYLCGSAPLTVTTGVVVLMIASLSTFAEAISPHGWDNAVLQILPAWLGAVMIPVTG